MTTRALFLILLAFAPPAHAWTEFKSSDKAEIRELLKHHTHLLDDYLIHAAENPGTKILGAHVKYITVSGESGGERVYTCEVQTELQLSDGTRLSEKVEVEKLCEHVF